jgi:hypothetical protein
MSDYQIPLGSKAQVAIYTEHWHHLSLLRKILLRMRSWQNYIFLEGHDGGWRGRTLNVRFGSKADIARDQLNVRFTPKSGHRSVS